MRIRTRKIAVVLALGSLGVLARCGGGGDDIGQIIGTNASRYHTVHTNPFIDSVDFGVNGTMKTSNVAFKSVSNYSGIDAAASTVTVPNTGNNTPLTSTGLTPTNGRRYTTLVLVGANGLAMSLTLINDPYNKSVLLDKTRARTFSALYNVPNADVYVTTPNVDLSAIALTMSGTGYGGASPTSIQNSIYVDSGTYQVQVVTAGTKNIILILQPLNLAGNADWLVTTSSAEGVGTVTPNTVRVLVTQTNGASQAASELPSQ